MFFQLNIIVEALTINEIFQIKKVMEVTRSKARSVCGVFNHALAKVI